MAETALDQRAQQLRLAVSDAEVSKRITEDPSTFRGAGGRFRIPSASSSSSAAPATPSPRYVAEQHSVTLRRQIAETVGGEIAVPATLREAMSRYQTEQRAVEYVLLDQKSKAGEIAAPAPEVLDEVFEDQQGAVPGAGISRGSRCWTPRRGCGNVVDRVSDDKRERTYEEAPRAT